VFGDVRVTPKRGRNWGFSNITAPDEYRYAKFGPRPQRTEENVQTNSLKAKFVGCRVIDEKGVFALLKVQKSRNLLFPDEFLQTERTLVAGISSTGYWRCAGCEYEVSLRKYSLVF